MNTLVVFYSRDGSTHKVAQAIADKLSCDIEEITETKSRKGLFGWIRSGYEASRQKAAMINPIKSNIADYDLVILGTPMWAGAMSSPVRGFFAQHGKDLPNVAFFCTKASSAGGKLFAGMEKVAGKAPIATLDLKMAEVQKTEFEEKLNAFTEQVQNA
jgi:flavodoxin